MVEKRFSAHDYEDVYKSLKLDTRNLGIVMLDTGALEVTKHVPGGEDDLHFSKKLKFGQGAVAEKGAHMTLLYGLLQPAYRWRDQVDAVLDNWTPPPITISEVGYFPGAVQGEDYSVIVGHIAMTDELMEGHQRLQLLPHIDTFPGFSPHVTLAYVKGGYHTRYKWIAALQDHYDGMEFQVESVSYGDENG